MTTLAIVIAIAAFGLGALVATMLVERREYRIADGQRRLMDVAHEVQTNAFADALRRERTVIARRIARRVGHIDTLAEIPGAELGLPDVNPLWDVARLIEREFCDEAAIRV